MIRMVMRYGINGKQTNIGKMLDISQGRLVRYGRGSYVPGYTCIVDITTWLKFVIPLFIAYFNHANIKIL